jgi:hypothetical protein
MSAPLPRVQHGAVLAGVKATPSGWPPACLTQLRATPTGSDGERDRTNPGLHGLRGLPPPEFGCPPWSSRG